MFMSKVLDQAKRRKNNNLIKGVAKTSTEVITGLPFANAIISATCAGVNLYRETRAIQLIELVSNGDENKKQLLLEILTDQEHNQNEIITSIIMKTIDESNKTKRYLLAKIMSYYVEHGEFDYLHETLFNNLNLLNEIDFEHLLVLHDFLEKGIIKKSQNRYVTEQYYYFSCIEKHRYLIPTIWKLISLQILSQYVESGAMGFSSGDQEDMRINFFLNQDYFYTIANYIATM